MSAPGHFYPGIIVPLIFFEHPTFPPPQISGEHLGAMSFAHLKEKASLLLCGHPFYGVPYKSLSLTCVTVNEN